MKNLSLEGFLKLINKYGATAVLSLWLFMNNVRINKLENQLYDCYKGGRSSFVQPQSKRDIFDPKKIVFVLPDKKKNLAVLVD